MRIYVFVYQAVILKYNSLYSVFNSLYSEESFSYNGIDSLFY
uniref:Uncharacterized protein n=1 Tax=Dulem virus 41 TaxID=3145759 RepID=A0AAU8AZ49_9CAUD